MPSSPKKSVLFVLVVSLAIAIVAVGTAYIFFHLFRSSSSGPKMVSVPTIEVAKASDSFLRTLSKGDVVGGSLSCDEKGKCQNIDSASLPTYAWRMLAFAGLYEANKDPAAKAELDKSFELLKGAYEPYRGNWTIFQVLEAFEATGEARYLDFAVRAAIPVLDRLRLKYSDESLTAEGLQLTATTSLQFSKLAALLSQQEYVEALKRLGLFVNGDGEVAAIRKDLISQAERTLTVSEKILSSYPVTFEESGLQLRVDFCWVLWAHKELASVPGHEDGLSKVKAQIESIAFSSRKEESFHFATLMEVAPCVQVLQDLGKHDTRYQQEAMQLLQRYVAPSWDASVSKLCSADGGFISVVNRTGSCGNRIKNSSVTSWVSFLMARSQGNISVVSK